MLIMIGSPLAVGDADRPSRPAVRPVLRVTLRFGDHRGRSIERRDLPQACRDGECGRNGAERTRQQPDAGSDERGARHDERHAVADAEWMSLEVRVPRQRRCGERARGRARAMPAPSIAHERPRDDGNAPRTPARRASVPTGERRPRAPAPRRASGRPSASFSATKKPLLTNHAPTVQRLLNRKMHDGNGRIGRKTGDRERRLAGRRSAPHEDDKRERDERAADRPGFVARHARGGDRQPGGPWRPICAAIDPVRRQRDREERRPEEQRLRHRRALEVEDVRVGEEKRSAGNRGGDRAGATDDQRGECPRCRPPST